MLYRLSKPHGYLLVSPTKPQVGSQRALAELPLVMEPQSALYTSPVRSCHCGRSVIVVLQVIVLDFRSLYPSIIIAYNLCYSTCLGTLQDATEARGFQEQSMEVSCLQQVLKRMGVLSDVAIEPATIKKLLELQQVLITPNGLLFARKEARAGILPRMLREILDTRVMIKKVAKREIARGASKRRLRY